MKKLDEWSLHTRAAKSFQDPPDVGSPLSEPIVRAVNHRAATAQQLRDGFRDRTSHVYQRFGNPTVRAAEEVVAGLEGAESAVLFASGMAAITTVLLTLVTRSGSHVVVQRDVFGQTFRFLTEVLSDFDVAVTFIDAPNADAVAAALRPETRLVYLESPSNPAVAVVDIGAIAAVTRARGLWLVVDGTFASPVVQQPLALGADIVVHSGTKFLNGHADVMCGAAAGSRQLMDRVIDRQILLGGIIDPESAWLLMRGLKTLPLRVERQSGTALAVAEFLAAHAAVLEVRYPFLRGAAGYDIATKQMRLGGGVLSFHLAGGIEAARRLLDHLELIEVATSLGGVESVIEIPADLDFGDEEIGAEAHEAARHGLIRLSIGLESPRDLIGDLQRALGCL